MEAMNATMNRRTMQVEQIKRTRRPWAVLDGVVRMSVCEYCIGCVVRSGSGMSMAV
jgi:hypothetical protein